MDKLEELASILREKKAKIEEYQVVFAAVRSLDDKYIPGPGLGTGYETLWVCGNVPEKIMSAEDAALQRKYKEELARLSKQQSERQKREKAILAEIQATY